MPSSRAIARVLQCVASRGFDSSVFAMTRSTSASEIVRGAPGRGSSSSPSRRFSRKRARQRLTMPRVTRSATPTSVLFLPSAHARTMRARSARPWLVFGRLVHRSSASRSSGVRMSGLSTGEVVIAVGIMTVDHDLTQLSRHL